MVGVEHLGADQVELDQAAGDGVAIRGAPALLVDIRLDGEPLARLVSVLQVLTHLDDGQRCLMSQAGGLHREVAVVQLGMAASLLEDLDVRETHTDAVDPDQQLVVIRLRDGERFRRTPAPHVLESRPV